MASATRIEEAFALGIPKRVWPPRDLTEVKVSLLPVLLEVPNDPESYMTPWPLA
jgi:hypothetical protein